MIQYIAVLLFFILALSLMLAALHFSRYKKRPSDCCGGLHCGESQEKVPGCHSEKADLAKNDRHRSGKADGR